MLREDDISPFEPIPELALRLRQRFPAVSVHELALADTAGPASFEFVSNAPAYGGLRPRDYDYVIPQVERITVSTDTLDNVIPRDATVAFVKIDVEGGEYHAMRGGISTIRRWMPPSRGLRGGGSVDWTLRRDGIGPISPRDR